MCNGGRGEDDGSQGCLLISYISWCRDKTLYLLLPRTLRDPPVQDTIDSPETTYRSGSNARRPRSHTPPGCILACMGSSCFMHPSLGYCLLARRLRGVFPFPCRAGVQGWPGWVLPCISGFLFIPFRSSFPWLFLQDANLRSRVYCFTGIKSVNAL